ncbi:MAG: thiamine pyrophosphate-dependent enzyme [Desulfocapsaceae bacterium]|nr:thiamine pyrophosphate-dependent enzyme [Desulfocapsaceae bacterium]
MASLLNHSRPLVFCPGCTHERIVRALDNALGQMNINGSEVVLVSDIGCSGLFDVFFHTHAFHGLHGRALTYALGLKMARPELQVIVTMGDGGMGIGGAHFLSACRRNANITLLILNNFNFGMTGGQYSATTPVEAITSSRFLNKLEHPLDICQIADAAGAPYVMRCSGLGEDLSNNIEDAISYDGFAVMDIWGICPGRYSRKNAMRKSDILDQIAKLTPYNGVIEKNERSEYVSSYNQICSELSQPTPPLVVDKEHSPVISGKKEILILGSAGQRIVTAGELLCLAAMTGGMQATQKNDYDITVLRGPSIAEIILWPEEIGYTGITSPDVIVVLSEDGIPRRRQSFAQMAEGGLVIHNSRISVPDCQARTIAVDFAGKGVGAKDQALGALAFLASLNEGISLAMLNSALEKKFTSTHLATAQQTLAKMQLVEQPGA